MCVGLLCCDLLNSSDDDDFSPIDDDDSSVGDDDDSAQSYIQSWTASFSAEALTQLSAENTVGRLSVSGSPGATAVETLVTVHSSSPVDLGPFAPLTINEFPDSLSIAVSTPESAEFTRIDLSVHAPSSLVAEVTSSSFPLAISDMTAGGSISTESGGVTGIGLAGNFEVSGGDSELLLELELPLDGVLNAVLASGPIELLLPTTTSANLTANASGGIVEITGMSFDGVVVGGEAQGQFGGGEGTIELSTEAGDILIRGQEPASLPDN